MAESEVEDVGLTEVARPSDEEVERVYKVLLDALLMPAAAAENLIKTQTIDKKWQMIQMNQVQFSQLLFRISMLILTYYIAYHRHYSKMRSPKQQLPSERKIAA